MIFQKGDLVVRVHSGLDESILGSWDTTKIGSTYIVSETLVPNYVRVFGARYAHPTYGQGWHRPECFRLYEPPKPETVLTDTHVPKKADV